MNNKFVALFLISGRMSTPFLTFALQWYKIRPLVWAILLFLFVKKEKQKKEETTSIKVTLSDSDWGTIKLIH